MIKYNRRTSKNKTWEIGSKVNVGFMKDLEVKEIRSSQNGFPDEYILKNTNGILYGFVPHNGIYKL